MTGSLTIPRAALGVLALSLVAGCAVDDDPAAADPTNAPVEVAAEEGDEGSEAPAASDDASGADDDGAGAPAGGATTAEDGWVALHGLEVPASGTAVLEAAGETHEMDIACYGPGVFGEGEHDEYQFRVSARGEFTWDDGSEGFFTVTRAVTFSPMQAYDYQGLDNADVTVTVVSGGEFHAATLAAPSDADGAGASLPLVHAQPDGTFTVDRDLEAASSMHENAPAGEVRIAGACDGPWADHPFG
ncbi:hypothetical protein [Demequina sp. SO4-18]|uniref:hypothetical protein n=1 Tax=Demequina sp. SO4-18 TaxID=3401026 RepID=UPI003B5B3A28